MSRRTRKQMVGKLEDVERALREEGLRHLKRELHWLCRSQIQNRHLLSAA